MDIETQLIDAEMIVRRIERDAEIATDLYQDLWLACLRQPSVDWSVPQVGRIVHITQRLRVNRFRRVNLRKEQSFEKFAAEQLVDDRWIEGLDGDTCGQLLAALVSLSPKHRRAVEQKYVVEQPDELLAIEMNVDVMTIRKWRSRGIQQLRVLLRGYESPTSPQAGSTK